MHARSWLKNQGHTDELFDGRPVIGIATTWSELGPCNAHQQRLAESVKQGVWQAGGFPLEFPKMAVGEPLMPPTAMLYRNLLAMSGGGDHPIQPVGGSCRCLGATEPQLPQYRAHFRRADERYGLWHGDLACCARVAPGGLAFVRSGDVISIDVPNRGLDLEVSEHEVHQRRAAWQALSNHCPRGYERLCWEQVLQAGVGADLDFLVGSSGSHIPRNRH